MLGFQAGSAICIASLTSFTSGTLRLRSGTSPQDPARRIDSGLGHSMSPVQPVGNRCFLAHHLVPPACPVHVDLGRCCLEMGMVGWVLSAQSLLLSPVPYRVLGLGLPPSLWGHLPILFCLVIQPAREEGRGEPGQASLPRAVASSGFKPAENTALPGQRM